MLINTQKNKYSWRYDCHNYMYIRELFNQNWGTHGKNNGFENNGVPLYKLVVGQKCDLSLWSPALLLTTLLVHIFLRSTLVLSKLGLDQFSLQSNHNDWS